MVKTNSNVFCSKFWWPLSIDLIQFLLFDIGLLISVTFPSVHRNGIFVDGESPSASRWWLFWSDCCVIFGKETSINDVYKILAIFWSQVTRTSVPPPPSFANIIHSWCYNYYCSEFLIKIFARPSKFRIIGRLRSEVICEPHQEYSWDKPFRSRVIQIRTRILTCTGVRDTCGYEVWNYSHYLYYSLSMTFLSS